MGKLPNILKMVFFIWLATMGFSCIVFSLKKGGKVKFFRIISSIFLLCAVFIFYYFIFNIDGWWISVILIFVITFFTMIILYRSKTETTSLIAIFLVPAICALISFPVLINSLISYNKSVNARSGTVTGCKWNLEILATALDMYAHENNGKYPRYVKKIVPYYLNSIPVCPSNGKDTYSSSYNYSDFPVHAFTLYCNGKNHSLGENEPHITRFNK